MLLILFLIFLAMSFGVVMHRTGLCTVRAVEEIIFQRKAKILGAFIKASIYVIAFSVPFIWFLPIQHYSMPLHALATPAVAGGFLFGVGAGLNQACSFSTLTRFATGELRMLFTITGFVSGFISYRLLLGTLKTPDINVSTQDIYRDMPLITVFIGAVLWLWVIFELVRIWRQSSQGGSIWQHFKLSAHHPAWGALVFGIINTLLIILWGSWSYTGTLHMLVSDEVQDTYKLTVRLLLFIAVLAGILISALTLHSFKFQAGHWRQRLSSFIGGTLMGIGIAMAPGGNSSLLLEWIPMFSPHALPSFIAVLFGIATTVLIRKWLGKGRD